MKLSSLSLALVCALCLLPAFLQSASPADGILVQAAPAAAQQRAPAASYAEENRDLEEDDDDVPVRRTTQQASSAVATDDATDEEATHKLTLRIQHAVGAGPFTPRGQVTLNYNPSKRAGGKAITFTPSQKVPRKELAALLRQSTDGSLLYRVEFLLAVGSSIVASVPACALVASHMHENFVFHADPYGTLVGVTYRTPITDCLSASEQAKVLAGDADAYFQTKGKVSFGRPGEKAKLHVRPGFDASAQAAAQAVGSETPTPAATANVERNADGTPVPPPQSFWQKYWIYIVPLGAFMLIQAVVAPPAEAAPARK